MRTRPFLCRAGLLGLLPLIALAIHTAAQAGSAIWNLDPRTGKWTTATNWTPATVPNGSTDIATFGTSNTRFVTLTGPIEVSGIVFNSGASAFNLTVSLNNNLLLSGAGVINDSGLVQTIVLPQDETGHASLITFSNSATAGELTTYFDEGEAHFLDDATAAGGTFATDTEFFDNSSAGHATFIVNGAVSSDPTDYGLVDFHDNSSAAEATFTLYGGTSTGLFGGHVTFNERASAADATFTVNGGRFIDGALGGELAFVDTSTAANCTIVANGSDFSEGGALILFNLAETNVGNPTIIINGGAKEGASILFLGATDGGTARIEVFDNGLVDLTEHDSPGITIGSLEGTGVVNLAQYNLAVGSNNLSTTFSGRIGGLGRATLTKIGTGTLTLSGANDFGGGTTITSGILLVSNISGSGTGAGAVSVNAGTLGGSGIIAGAVTVGTNTGVQAFLAPSKGAKKPATLTIQGSLTLNDDSTCIYKLNPKRAISDEVIANGVVIDSGAKFSFRPTGNKALTVGQVFAVISNTAATPIAGVFHNLPEGKILTVNGSRLQASYSGGDGNDLILTVVP